MKIPESTVSTATAPTVFEAISTGTGQNTFRRKLAELAAVANEELDKRIPCTVVSEVPVLDPAAAAVVGRASAGHTLTSCTLLQAGLQKSWEVASVTGWFVDGVLSRVTWRVKKDLRLPVSSRLEKRFGKGSEITATALSVLGRTTVPMTVWRIKGEVWAVEMHPNDAAVTRQADGILGTLPLPAAASEKGRPVSLDDIGLGGPIDVRLDDIAMPDVPRPDASPTPTP